MADSQGDRVHEGFGDESSSKRDQDKLLPGGSGHESGGDESSSKRDQDKLLPIANVSRIIKKGLRPDAKISKEAKMLIQEATNEFISFIISEASYICLKDNRRAINEDDLLEAIALFDFEDYIEPMTSYLEKYREGYPIKDGPSSQNEQLDVSNLMKSSQNEEI